MTPEGQIGLIGHSKFDNFAHRVRKSQLDEIFFQNSKLKQKSF